MFWELGNITKQIANLIIFLHNYNFQHWAMEELLYNSMIGVSLLNYHKTKQRGGGYGI